MRTAVYVLAIVGGILGLGGGACAGACGAATEEFGKADKQISGKDTEGFEGKGKTIQTGGGVAMLQAAAALIHRCGPHQDCSRSGRSGSRP